MRALQKVRLLARRLVERERPVILMYHRVARMAHDPWQLAVSPNRFAEQIEALMQVRRVVPLDWVAAELCRGHLPRKVAAITFDDGYADILAEARPILERNGCPATVFLVTGMIGKGCAFWWDQLSRIILETPSLPTKLEIEIAGSVHRWQTDNCSADGAGDGPAIVRQKLHDKLYRILRPLKAEPRDELLLRLGTWAGIEIEAKSIHRPLAPEEVRRLADPGFIDIGAHTVTHPALPLLNGARQRSEIEDSRAACQELIGRPIHTFAYPFGDFDDASVACVRSSGFACACTTVAGAVSMRSDPMLLPRYTVGNWPGDDLARKISTRV
jgi:peptidoglycan/xylan/chitin deacetylase (PgdA/CDA1 family)